MIKMKTLFIFFVMIFVGCSTPISRVQTKINCQDYANAWCRNAIERGLDAGVIWYKNRDTGVGHAICWVVDPEDQEIKYVEPQTRYVVPCPLDKENVYTTYWNDKPGFNNKDIEHRRFKASLGIR